MSHQSEFDKSLVLLFSAVAKGVFGTGFIIEQTGDATIIATCRHVVRDIVQSRMPGAPAPDGIPPEPEIGQEVENVRISGIEDAHVSLLAIGPDDAFDMAVLEVRPPLREPPVAISRLRTTDAVALEGHSAERTGMYLRKPADGDITFHVDQISMQTGEIVVGWQIKVKPGFALHDGFSGSPVMDSGSGAVFGVANAKSTDGSTGLVLELSNLPRIWPPSESLFVENCTVLFSHPDDSSVADELVLGLKDKLQSPVRLHLWHDKPIDTLVAAESSRLLLLWTDSLANHCAQLVETTLKSRKAAEKPFVPVSIAGSPPPGPLEVIVPQNAWCNYLKADDLNRLVWSITGENPAPPEVVAQPPEPEALAPVSKALTDLVEHLKSGSVTFVVGCARPAESQIVGKLISTAGIPGPAQILPLDFTGTCFSFSRNVADLDEEMRVLHTLDGIPQAYEDLCRIIRKGTQRQPRRLNAPVQPQLIVTTNLDSGLEVSLLHAGIPFMRIVHDRSSVVLYVSEFEEQDALVTVGRPLEEILNYAAEVPITVIKQDMEQHNGGKVQNALQNLSLGSAKVVLYKLIGSNDIKRSAVVTTEQLLSYLPTLQSQSATPIAITGILNNTYLLLLGYGHLDLSFRVVQQFLSKVDGRFDRFMVQPRPPSDTPDPLRMLERNCWTNLTDRRLNEMNMMTVQQNPAAFVSSLAQLVT
jgi:hypothetical protein